MKGGTASMGNDSEHERGRPYVAAAAARSDLHSRTLFYLRISVRSFLPPTPSIPRSLPLNSLSLFLLPHSLPIPSFSLFCMLCRHHQSNPTTSILGTFGNCLLTLCESEFSPSLLIIKVLFTISLAPPIVPAN